MKIISCLFIAPLFVAACGKKSSSSNPQPQQDPLPQQEPLPQKDPLTQKDPQPKQEDVVGQKKTDQVGELTSEGFVKCSPDAFVPMPTLFKVIEDSQDFSYIIVPSEEVDGKASFMVWGGKSECMENIHKFAYYGDFKTSITTQIDDDEVIRYSVKRDDVIYMVGSGKVGDQPLCSGIENCSFSISKDSEGKLMIKLSLNNVILVNEEFQLSKEPIFIPFEG